MEVLGINIFIPQNIFPPANVVVNLKSCNTHKSVLLLFVLCLACDKNAFHVPSCPFTSFCPSLPYSSLPSTIPCHIQLLPVLHHIFPIICIVSMDHNMKCCTKVPAIHLLCTKESIPKPLFPVSWQDSQSNPTIRTATQRRG